MNRDVKIDIFSSLYMEYVRMEIYVIVDVVFMEMDSHYRHRERHRRREGIRPVVYTFLICCL